VSRLSILSTLCKLWLVCLCVCVRETEREGGGGKSRQLTGVEEEREKRSMNNTYFAERKCSCVCFLTGELFSFFCSSRSL
jgi:hypothetical protein